MGAQTPYSSKLPTEDMPFTTSRKWRLVRRVILLLILASVILFYGKSIWTMAQDPVALQAQVDELGLFGPLALISVNILQIVVAPIPGYGVYLVAGLLFGAWMGGVWGSVGLLLGGMVAMFIGRNFGRPLVKRIIGPNQLTRWEEVTHSNNILVWAVILLSPIGDIPFLLAGLSNIRYSTIFILTVITRIPAAFLAAAIGSGVLQLSGLQLTAIVLLLAIPLTILYQYQDAILHKFEQLLQWVLRTRE